MSRFFGVAIECSDHLSSEPVLEAGSFSQVSPSGGLSEKFVVFRATFDSRSGQARVRRFGAFNYLPWSEVILIFDLLGDSLRGIFFFHRTDSY